MSRYCLRLISAPMRDGDLDFVAANIIRLQNIHEKKQIEVFMIITSSMEEYLFPEVHKKRDKLMSIYFSRNVRTSIEGCDRFSQDMHQGTSIWKILLFLTYVTRQCKMQRENL